MKIIDLNKNKSFQLHVHKSWTQNCTLTLAASEVCKTKLKTELFIKWRTVYPPIQRNTGVKQSRMH